MKQSSSVTPVKQKMTVVSVRQTRSGVPVRKARSVAPRKKARSAAPRKKAWSVAAVRKARSLVPVRKPRPVGQGGKTRKLSTGMEPASMLRAAWNRDITKTVRIRQDNWEILKQIKIFSPNSLQPPPPNVHCVAEHSLHSSYTAHHP